MIRRAVLCAAALAASLAGAASAKPDLVYEKFGERRAFFKAQLAACRPTGFCSVLAYAGAGPNAAGVDADYVIRVASDAPGADYRLVFTGVKSFVAEDSAIDVIVDGRRVALLEPGADRGWRGVERVVNEYAFAPSVSHQEIVPAMKAGARLTLAFRSTAGAAERVTFSLLGLTAALRWIETARFGS